MLLHVRIPRSVMNQPESELTGIASVQRLVESTQNQAESLDWTASHKLTRTHSRNLYYQMTGDSAEGSLPHGPLITP